MGTDQTAGRHVASEPANPSPMAGPALRRQTPEVGAVCGNPARTDLCGGRPVMDVPTAIAWNSGTRISRRRVDGVLHHGTSITWRLFCFRFDPTPIGSVSSMTSLSDWT